MPEKIVQLNDISTTVEVSNQTTLSGSTVSFGGVGGIRPSSLSLRTETWKAGGTTIGGAIVATISGYAMNCDFPANLKEVLSAASLMGGGECTAVTIACGGQTILSGCGRIVGVSAEEGPDPTWTTVAPYSVEVEIYTNNGQRVVNPSNDLIGNNLIIDYSASSSVTYDDSMAGMDSVSGGSSNVGDAHSKVSFDISVTGGLCGCSCDGLVTGMEAAEAVVAAAVGRYGDGGALTTAQNTSALNLSSDVQIMLASGSRFLHSRTVSRDELSCSMGASGSFIIRPDEADHPHAFTTLTAEPRSDVRNKGDVVVVSGSAKGLHALSFSDLYSASLASNRMANARSAASALMGESESIANAHLRGISDDCPVDNGFLGVCDQLKAEEERCPLRLISKSESYSHGEGTVSWTYEYSTEKFCSIPGASNGYVEITDNYPTDVLAEFVIPFRGSAFIQNLGTQTKHTKNLNATVSVDGACGGVNYQENLQCILSYLDSLIPYGWYKTAHSETTSTNGDVRISMEFTKPSGCT